MNNMIADELQKILENHKRWLRGCKDGVRADLRGANLCGAYLREADLRGAKLQNACLTHADIKYADLFEADLRGANMREANLRFANLVNANLKGASLREADIRDANLKGAKNVPFIPMTCPDTGEFIGWKKAGGYIVKLLILSDAKRSSATGRKCRCSKAKVLSIETVDGTPKTVDGTPVNIRSVVSDFDSKFIYVVGETVTVKDFCDDRFNECAQGIHFFVNRQEAVDYYY